MNPTYLGDGVYVAYQFGRLQLYTDDGYGPHNVIYLEGEVYDALTKFVERLNHQEVK